MEWRAHRSADGIEYYNYPSALALKYWLYVHCIGQARCPPGYRHQTQPRDGYLLHYIRGGALRHHIHNRIVDVQHGQACLMEMSSNVQVTNEGTKSVENWWVLFDGRDLPHLFTELRADRRPVFDSVDETRFEALFCELLDLTRLRPVAYEAKSAAALSGILAELFVSLAKHEDVVGLIGRTAVLSESVRKGIDYMTRFHSQSDLGLKRICEAAGLSLYHFVRLFRREVGLTPGQYLTRYRIAQAKRLLAESDKTMDQIARQIGASSQNYFSYLFRRETGTTPRAYRAKATRGRPAGARPPRRLLRRR